MLNIKYIPHDRFIGDTESFEQFQSKIKKVSAKRAKELAVELKNLMESYNWVDDQILKLILDGADLGEVKFGKYNDNPLIYSAKKNKSSWFKMFARAGIDVDSVNDYGTSSIMSASRKGFLEIMDLCLFIGADVNLQCKDGDTAMHSAFRHNSVDALKKLYLNGADFEILNNEGKFPEEVASPETLAAFHKIINDKTSQTITTKEDVANQISSAKQEFKALTASFGGEGK